MLELGPDAPTLCEGWTTFDLAAHLMLREHFRRSSPSGLARARTMGFESVVARLQQGAPLIPWRLPRLRRLLNGTEYFIHHEDVRRANGMPRRAGRPDLEALAWGTAGYFGRRIWRAMKPYGLELRRPDGAHRRFGTPPAAIVSGEATELVLYGSGRRAAAAVAVSGAAAAMARLQQTDVRL